MFHNRSTFPSLKCINICTTALSSLPSSFLCSVSLPGLWPHDSSAFHCHVPLPNTQTSPSLFLTYLWWTSQGQEMLQWDSGKSYRASSGFQHLNIHLSSNMPLLWGDSQWEKDNISSNLVFKHFLVDPSFPPLQLIEKAGYASNPISSQCLMTPLTLQVSLPQLGTSLVTRVVAELPQ